MFLQLAKTPIYLFAWSRFPAACLRMTPALQGLLCTVSSGTGAKYQVVKLLILMHECGSIEPES